MYKTLLNPPSEEPLFIRYIADKQLGEKLLDAGFEEGTEITLIKKITGTSSGKSQPTDLLIESKEGQEMRISADEAKDIFLSACDICWSCGNCMDD